MERSLESKYESMAAEIMQIRDTLTRILSVLGSRNNHRQENKIEEPRNMPLLVQGLLSKNRAMQVEATIRFRNLSATGGNSLIAEVIQAGAVPQFVEFLGRQDLPQLQYEAAWVLNNIIIRGTPEHTKIVVDHGAVPKFVQLLMTSRSENVLTKAAWALGNISMGSPRYSTIILGCNALDPLLYQLNGKPNKGLLRAMTWTLSTFFRGEVSAPFEQVKPALPVLAKLIHLSDGFVLKHACFAIDCFSNGQNNQIQGIIEAGVCPQLVKLLRHRSLQVLMFALRTIRNILYADVTQTQVVIENQVLPCFFLLLTNNPRNDIMKEVIRSISKIMAGNRNQIQAVIEANIIPPLVHILKYADPEAKLQALWAITNAILGGSHEQIRILANQGCLKPLCHIPISSFPSARALSLVGIKKIIQVGEDDKEAGMNGGVNIYAQEMIEWGVRQE